MSGSTASTGGVAAPRRGGLGFEECSSSCVTPVPFGTIQHCRLCHQTFGGECGGDRHRIVTGTYDLVRLDNGRVIRSAPGSPVTGGRLLSVGNQTRRCRTVAEMVAVDLALDSRGVWVRRYPATRKPVPETPLNACA